MAISWLLKVKSQSRNVLVLWITFSFQVTLGPRFYRIVISAPMPGTDKRSKKKASSFVLFFFCNFFLFFLVLEFAFSICLWRDRSRARWLFATWFSFVFFVYFFYLSPISRWHITRPHTNTRARLRWAMRPPQNETKKMTAIVVDICFCGVFVFGYLLLGALFFFSFLLSCWVFFLAWTHSSETIDGGRNQQSLRCLRWWISVDFSSAVRAEVCDRRAAG